MTQAYKKRRASKNTTKTKSIFQLAMHEAGHAVVAAYYRLPIKEVSIIPGKDEHGEYVGQCVVRPSRRLGIRVFRWVDSKTGLPTPWRDVRNDITGRYEAHARTDEELKRLAAAHNKQDLRKHICVNYAGIAAETLVHDVSNGCDGAQRDEQMAEANARLALGNSASDFEIGEYLSAIMGRMCALVRRPFMESAINEVALELMQCRVLPGRRVNQIFAKAKEEAQYWTLALERFRQ